MLFSCFSLKQKKTAVRKQAAQHHLPLVAAGNVSMQPITAFSTASSNIKSKNAAQVSISVTPVSSVTSSISSIAQVANPLKMKNESVVFPHSVSTGVVRTKYTAPIETQANVPASISSSYVSNTSSVRNLPSSTNTSRLPSQHLSAPPSISNRKKTVSDVTIAKVVNSSGKNSPNFQAEKQPSVLSVKPKMNVDRVSPKTIDLSTSGVNRSLVNNVPENPSKSKGSSENNSMSQSIQKNILNTLPLMNIPDCISVTPSLPSPNHSQVVTTISPPITTSTPKSMMSLKQRILHDTNLDQSKVKPTSEDDGIEVIEVVKDKKLESTMPIKPVARSENVMQPKGESRKRKKMDVTVASHNSVPPDKSVVEASAISGPASTITTTVYSSNSCITSTTTYSSPATALSSTASIPAHQPEKDVERMLKDEEEAAAAADYLSQINESLKNLNSSAVTVRDIFQTEEGIGLGSRETPHSVSPKVETLPSPLSLSPSTEQKQKKISIEENDKTKVNDLRRKTEIPSTPQDDEESVQMEVDRVMKELQELQQLSAEKNRETDYSPVKSVIIPKGASGATNCSSLTMTTGKTQTSKANKLYSDNSIAMPVLGRRPSGGSTSEQAKMSYGFQDEFQKHLFQDLSKQCDVEVPNNCKIPKNKGSGGYSHVNQPAMHDTVSSQPSQNSSLEGKNSTYYEVEKFSGYVLVLDQLFTQTFTLLR